MHASGPAISTAATSGVQYKTNARRDSTVFHNIGVLAALAFLSFLLPADVRFEAVEQSLTFHRYRAALDQLSAVESRDSKWHLLASRAYDGLNDPMKAVQEAEAALALDPRNPACHLQLAQIFLSRNTPQAALEILTEAEVQFPDVFVIQLGKGLAQKELQQYGEAEKSLQWCLRRQPDSALAFDGLATVYLHQMRFAGLRDLAAEFLTHNSGDYRGYYFLAAGREGDLMAGDETRALIRKALDRNASFAAAHALAGKVLLREGKFGDAVAPLKRAIELRPDLVQAHLNLARALRATGDESGSAQEFSVVRRLKAKEQEPVPSLVYHRGQR